jgi:hypothetical protein
MRPGIRSFQARHAYVFEQLAYPHQTITNTFHTDTSTTPRSRHYSAFPLNYASKSTNTRSAPTTSTCFSIPNNPACIKPG